MDSSNEHVTSPDCMYLLYIWNLGKIWQPQYIVVGFSSISGTSVLIRSMYLYRKIPILELGFLQQSTTIK